MTDAPTLDEVFEEAKRLSIADQQAFVIRIRSRQRGATDLNSPDESNGGRG